MKMADYDVEARGIRICFLPPFGLAQPSFCAKSVVLHSLRRLLQSRLARRVWRSSSLRAQLGQAGCEETQPLRRDGSRVGKHSVDTEPRLQAALTTRKAPSGLAGTDSEKNRVCGPSHAVCLTGVRGIIISASTGRRKRRQQGDSGTVRQVQGRKRREEDARRGGDSLLRGAPVRCPRPSAHAFCPFLFQERHAANMHPPCHRTSLSTRPTLS